MSGAGNAKEILRRKCAGHVLCTATAAHPSFSPLRPIQEKKEIHCQRAKEERKKLGSLSVSQCVCV